MIDDVIMLSASGMCAYVLKLFQFWLLIQQIAVHKNHINAGIWSPQYFVGA